MLFVIVVVHYLAATTKEMYDGNGVLTTHTKGYKNLNKGGDSMEWRLQNACECLESEP